MLKALGRGISHTYFKMTVYCQKKEETTATIINYLRPNEACSKLCRCFLHLYTGSCGVSNTAQINRFGPSFLIIFRPQTRPFSSSGAKGGGAPLTDMLLLRCHTPLLGKSASLCVIILDNHPRFKPGRIPKY